jgi:uncharacterized protein (TIGR02266 family)
LHFWHKRMGEQKKPEQWTHFRGKARPGRRVEIGYRRTDQPDAAFTKAVTRNIGVGGAYVLTNDPEKIGTTLAIRLTIPTAPQDIEVKGEVRWGNQDGDEEDAGMGVVFLDIDVDCVLVLGEYFASLTGAED